LDGITRRTVIEIAKSKNIKVIERKISPNELKDFVGCFLTGTAAEVKSVTRVNKTKIGNGKIGEVTKELQESFMDTVMGKNKKFRSWLKFI
ncbi:MAG: aminotransferase class IV, partial [Thermoproteota archaeon]|nr:aminotransferase class IV [Thermoproteota archaeon]